VSICHPLAFQVLLKLSREFINLLQEMFPPLILQDQDCFAGEAGAEELLALLPANEPLRNKWAANPDRSSEQKWDDIRNQVKIHGKTSPPGVSPPFDAETADGDLLRSRRNSSGSRWKISSSNTLGLESTPRSRNIETTCSRLPFASTQRRAGSVSPWIQRGSRNSIRPKCQLSVSC